MRDHDRLKKEMSSLTFILKTKIKHDGRNALKNNGKNVLKDVQLAKSVTNY